jgi:hypothetical protein
MPRSNHDDDMVRQPILNAEAQNDNDDNDLEFEEITGCGASPLCNPSSSLHRFIALIFMCLLGFGESL